MLLSFLVFRYLLQRLIRQRVCVIPGHRSRRTRHIPRHGRADDCLGWCCGRLRLVSFVTAAAWHRLISHEAQERKHAERSAPPRVLSLQILNIAVALHCPSLAEGRLVLFWRFMAMLLFDKETRGSREVMKYVMRPLHYSRYCSLNSHCRCRRIPKRAIESNQTA